MNWLYFFGGVTSAWVFMGVFITIWSLIDPKRKQQSEMNQRLIDYWEESERLKNLELEELRDIANAIYYLKGVK